MPPDGQLREHLEAWRASVRATPLVEAARLPAMLRRRLDGERVTELLDALEAFAPSVTGVVEDAAVAGEGSPPVHVPFDAVGRRQESIAFHPSYAQAGRSIWASGILACQDGGGGAYEQAALFYLLAHAGEGGHACPVACTAGLVRALQDHGSAPLRERYLPGLVEDDYDRALRGAQFLTEVHGGSDVGANTTRAVADVAGDGWWRIHGEKWFCSVADADLFAVIARIDGSSAGTRGLGCFLVPRRSPDGSPNGFRIRRLKPKLGTRAMATAEIDFDGARGTPIGSPEAGFHVAVEALLNTSRWLNALGSAALAQRADIEASAFARHRTAFGGTIDRFPLVREALALIRAEARASLLSSLEVTDLLDRRDAGGADRDDVAFHRLLVNANKYVTSVGATSAVRRAIEVLGGNGTIEDFSPLPRLYRDSIVFESWEGTHNVLCEQVRRDCARYDLLDGVLARLHARLGAVDHRALDEDRALVVEALERLTPRLRAAIADEGIGAAHFRRHLHTLTRVVQAVCLLAEADAELHGTGGRDTSTAAVAGLHVRRHLVVGYEPDADPGHLERIDRVVGGG